MAALYWPGASRVHIGVHQGREIFTFKTVVNLDPQHGGNVRPHVVQLRIDAGELARMLGCKALQEDKTEAALPGRRVVATIIREYTPGEGADNGSPRVPD